MNAQSPPTSEAELEVRDPGDGSVIARVPRATRADVESAIAKAQRAAGVARALPAFKRTEVLRRAADLIELRHEEFATTIAREGVKAIREARIEVSRCVQTFRLSAEEAHRLCGQTIAFDQVHAGERRVGYYLYEPVGIVGAITPFNDPLNLVAHKVGPALAAGNVVVLKPDSATPLSALAVASTLAEAGLPENFLQVLVGAGSEVGAAIVSDPRVAMISFTGGRATGDLIFKTSGIKKVSMELGGNCATIVLDDASLDRAVPDCVSGAFWAAGQNCLHVQRLLVQDRIYEEFAEALTASARAYKVGPKLDESTDMGPMIDEAAAQRVEAAVAGAVRVGASILTGGQRSGPYYAPTLIENVSPSTPLYCEEVYGPVTILDRIATLDEGIERANAVDYGLQAAIFTRDVTAALAAVRDLRCGAVIVNGSTDYRDDGMPFGGVKGSGIGREGVSFAAREMSEPKVVCFNL